MLIAVDRTAYAALSADADPRRRNAVQRAYKIDHLFLHGGIVSSIAHYRNAAYARRLFLVYRDGGGQSRTSYLTVYAFPTDRNIVRITYDCYGAQRTMIDDLYGVQDLFNSIMVP